VEALRALRRAGPSGEMVALSATDPLNLVGVLTPGPRVPSLTGNAILLRDGVPIASRESGQVVPRASLGDEERASAERALDPATRARAAS
jgi:ATP-dependent Lhr-like helicase